MGPSSDYYDIVVVYIRTIKRESPAAAAAVEEILATYGSRAALRATLVITLLKMEVQKNHSVENISVPMHLVKDFPEVLPLLEQAITCYLQARSRLSEEPSEQAEENPADDAGEPSSSAPEVPSV